MSTIDIIRAWKDEDYRNSLSEEQKAQLPDNPAGAINLTDEQMSAITGGAVLILALGCGGGGRLKDPSMVTVNVHEPNGCLVEPPGGW